MHWRGRWRQFRAYAARRRLYKNDVRALSPWPGTSRDVCAQPRLSVLQRCARTAAGVPKISPPPLRAIAAMFFGEIYDSIRGRIDFRQKIKPESDRLLVHLNGR